MSAATSLLTPATSSLTLISIGWLKPNATPGTCSVKSLSISSIKASRVKPGAPLVLRFEHGPDVGLVHAHHVVGDLGAARLAIDQAHFGDRLQEVFDLGRRGHGPFERGRRDAHGLDQEVSLVESRHELAPQAQCDRHGGAEERQGHDDRGHWMADEGVERG